MADCGWLDFGCNAEEIAKSAIGDAIENMANAVLEAFGKAVASLGTLWVNIGTPNLTSDGGSSPIGAGESAPGSEGIVTILGYVTWISFAIAAIGMRSVHAVTTNPGGAFDTWSPWLIQTSSARCGA